MTVKEAILKVLEEQKEPMTHTSILEKIDENQYYDWKVAKTPANTVAAQLYSFIKQNDTRVKRIKGNGNYFLYYLAKLEDELNLTEIIESTPTEKVSKKTKVYQERDLHKLLSSYLKNKNTYSKTIFHEKSANSKDNHQKWIHPDMIGIKFLNLKNKSSQALLKVINKADAFELVSYEIKRDIKSDYDLKKCYFQAVSNSSWANYCYLVAFDINSNLKDEMERLNQSFGIGIIELKANPYESEILFPSKYKELDFKTIDKLCEINKDFEKFIEQTETLLIATERYIKGTKKEFEEFCDSYFKADSEIEKYCKEKNIPIEEEKTV
ncbi:MAG: HTH domain-containing protein [Cellulophaga sp.]